MGLLKMPYIKGYYKRTKDGRRVWVKPHFRKPAARTYTRLRDQFGRNLGDLDDSTIVNAISDRTKELDKLRWRRNDILHELMRIDEEVPRASSRRLEYLLHEADKYGKKLQSLNKQIPQLEDEIAVLKDVSRKRYAV